jgi:replicative DNA helicase
VEENLLNAESACIGCAVLSEQCAAEVFSMSADDFTAFRTCFEELQALWKKDGRIDAATISTCEHKAEAMQCSETVPSVSLKNCRTYIKHVQDAAKVARAQSIALGISIGDQDLESITEMATNLVNALNDTGDDGEWLNMTEGMVQWFSRMQSTPNYIKSGFGHLDNVMRISPGDYIVVAGRPSAGKTAFSLNMALGFAKKGKRVAYFSLETSSEKIMDRLCAVYYSIPFEQIKNHAVQFDDYEVQRNSKEFAKLPILIREASGRTVGWMRAQAARVKADVVMIDYIGLIKSQGKDRYEKVTNISLDLHEWAQRDKVTIVALSQMNRNAKANQEKAPTLEDLRESGQIEQDADAVILLNNPQDAPYQCIVGKNKEGITGDIGMRFDGEMQMFYEVDNEH